MRAIDGDRGVNNRINYSIIRGANDLFRIDHESGIVFTTKELDREDPQNQVNGAYILEILATEKSKIIVSCDFLLNFLFLRQLNNLNLLFFLLLLISHHHRYIQK